MSSTIRLSDIETRRAQDRARARLESFLPPADIVQPGEFLGRPEAWFQFAAQSPGFRAQHLWCAEHWAPAPVLGADATQASKLLLALAVAHLIPGWCNSDAARKRWLEKQIVPVCCQIQEKLGGSLDSLWR